jgi:GntR family transcriptional regulator / MocR family aminotransferase
LADKETVLGRTAAHIPIAGIAIDRNAAESLSKQLYDGLRQAILRGQLRPGTRLPSTRSIAHEYGISRNVAASAYDQLFAEGYLDAKIGSGTCVGRHLPDELLAIGAAAPAVAERASPRRTLSARGKLVARDIARHICGRTSFTTAIRPLTVSHQPQAFESGLPDASMFPFKIWSQLLAKHWRRPRHELLAYSDPAGLKSLREAIAAYLRTGRAVRCNASQVMIVNGSQHALDLAARLLIDPGDTALIEDPGYPGGRIALQAAGATLAALPVDSEGANIAAVRDRAQRPRLIFVTPSHQFPLGVTMSVTRRLELLHRANRWGAWVLEDDYDSEYRYQGKPLPALQGLDGTGRVLYMGTFSKTLFPSLRLGFLVLPADLIEPFRQARSIIDGHSPMTEQAVLADFITEGHFARHIRRMRAIYQERQSALFDAVQRELGGFLTVHLSEGGMHLVGRLPHGVSDVAAAQRAATAGIFTRPLSFCSIKNVNPGGLLLGYAALTPQQIHEGVQKLAAALQPFAKSA